VLRFLRALAQANGAHKIDDAAVDGGEKQLGAAKACVPNDEHIIALARRSGARIVRTEDEALMDDLKNNALLGTPRGRLPARPARPTSGQV
jgi:hypothetical protein